VFDALLTGHPHVCFLTNIKRLEGPAEVGRNVSVIYHGQPAGHCEEEVKDFERVKGCYGVAAYETLDATKTICKCGGMQCNSADLPFESHARSKQ